ncbi:MAG: hypothetical protein M1838_002693 [Thelocarpon superellum]|nr:MAG: hypothetical protein M1838_002693 [Thelocarpon superellum]
MAGESVVMSSLLVLWCIFFSAVKATEMTTSTNGTDSYLYPDGPRVNASIEYLSRFRNGTVLRQLGLNDSRDQAWDEYVQGMEMMFDPTSPNASRWLPPLSWDYDGRLTRNDSDVTDILARNDRRPYTSLWQGSPFWKPACGRLAAELARLQAIATAPAHQGKIMEIELKHYGANFPDANQQHALVWTYVHLMVFTAGSHLPTEFADGCEAWLGELAADAQVFRQDTADANSTTEAAELRRRLQLPPLKLRATSGGIKRVNSDFTLWLIPAYQFAPGSAKR